MKEDVLLTVLTRSRPDTLTTALTKAKSELLYVALTESRPDLLVVALQTDMKKVGSLPPADLHFQIST